MPIDKPTIEKAMIPVTVTEALLVMASGRQAATARSRTPQMVPRWRTTQILRSASGTGRRACTAAQEPFSSSRPGRRRCTKSPRRMMAKSVTSTRPERG